LLGSEILLRARSQQASGRGEHTRARANDECCARRRTPRESGRDRPGGEGTPSTSRWGSPPQLAAASDALAQNEGVYAGGGRVHLLHTFALQSRRASLCACWTRFGSHVPGQALLTFVSFRKFYAYPTVGTFTNALLLSEENATAENLHLASASRQLARKPGRADRRAARQGPAALINVERLYCILTVLRQPSYITGSWFGC
jgi:hypothetical protein